MTSPAPIIELPIELRRTAAATAFAAASLLGSVWVLVQGLELIADDLCFGPCPPATHGAQGGSLVLVGLAALLVSLIAAPRIAQSSHPVLRAFAAIPAAAFVGIFCISFGVRYSAGLTNLAEFLVIATAIAVLVPPRRREWFGGLAAGCLIAAAFAQRPQLSIVIAVAVLVAASSLTTEHPRAVRQNQRLMTSMKDQLQTDLTDAIRARDEIKLATLRMALAAITKAEVAGKEHVALSDDDIVGVLRSEIKKRNDAAEMYETGGRADRADRERTEAEVLATYLPPAMDDDALAAIVAEEVAAIGADENRGKAMGQVVKAVRARAGDGADGSRIAAAVKAALGMG